MTFVRRRYYFWLFKAYIRKWKKTIFASLIIGFVAFFLFVAFLNFYLLPFFRLKIQKIGYSGVFAPNELPDKILSDISYGLTKVEQDGTVVPAAASRWDIKNDGKTYVFYIKPGQKFHNNTELRAKNISLNFKDVSKKIISDYVVSFELKNPYSPFLVSVSKPIFISNFQGLGEYKVKKIELNGGFVKSISMQNRKNANNKKILFFYPTQLSLKTAYVLGEINKATGLTSLDIKDHELSNWKTSSITKSVNYDELVSLFYNNSDSNLSNKKLRQALNYSLPLAFQQGERAFSPIYPNSVYFSKPPNFGISDKDISETLLVSVKGFSQKLEISTTEEYQELAHIIVKNWEEIGIKTQVKIVQEAPKSFQILLYPFNVSKDPDQYTLWHSDQVNNIIKYKNLRIDKLLEDGRSTTSIEKRTAIYADFQKYLTDDVPASFLYFPYIYTVSKR